MVEYSVFKNLLSQKNVKTVDVANATGISPSTFSDWKSGKSRPKLDKISAIADYFGVPIETFLES